MSSLPELLNSNKARLSVLAMAMLASACIPRYGEEWLAPHASGRITVAGPQGVQPLVGAKVSYLAAPSRVALTDTQGNYQVAGVAENAFSMQLPASGSALRPLRVEAAGFPTVILHVRSPLPAHTPVDVQVSPLMLVPTLDDASRPPLDIGASSDCEEDQWNNAVTLWHTARQAARVIDAEESGSLLASTYRHARTAWDVAYYGCEDAWPYKGRFRINEIRRTLDEEAARFQDEELHVGMPAIPK